MFRVYLQITLIFALIGGGTLNGQGTVDSPLSKANQAFKNGEFAAALKAYQWYRSDAKLGATARIQSGHCLLKLGNPSGAAQEWRGVRESFPNAPEAAIALGLEISATTDSPARKKLEDTLLADYAESIEAKALLAARAKVNSTANTKITPESELDQLLAAGKREDAIKLLIAKARRATGEERDLFLAQLATLYESTGDWQKASGAWQKIAEEGNAKYRETATFDWIRTTAAMGKNAELVESMWLKFLRDHPTSPRGHLAVTQLADMMVARGLNDRAAALLSGWLAASEEKSPGADLVSKRLADLQKQAEAAKGGKPSSFGKERLEAIAKLPAELEILCTRARTGKNTDSIINRVREMRRSLATAQTDPALLIQLDRTEALALNGQRDPRRALDLLEDAWARISNLLPETKEPSLAKAAREMIGDAIAIAMEAGNHSSVVAWVERTTGSAIAVGEAEIDLLKEAALRLVLADAKDEGIKVLSILGSRLLVRLPEDSRLRIEETATVERLKMLCAKGAAVVDDEWFVGEMPSGLDSRVARTLFEADLLFAARETEKASRAYSDVIRKAGISKDTEGYATLQLARALAALGNYEEALHTYGRFEDSLGATKSAAPALLRAGTLCGGPLNDSRRAKEYFSMVSTRYPAAPEAELCDWYTANLILWEGDHQASRTAFDHFEKKYPQSAFIPTLNKFIRPQL